MSEKRVGGFDSEKIKIDKIQSIFDEFRSDTPPPELNGASSMGREMADKIIQERIKKSLNKNNGNSII